MRAELSPAVFLDRDSTLIEDRGDLSDTADVVFFPETIAALQRLGAHYRLFMVTDQSGVSKGTITHDDVQRINAFVTADIREAVDHILAHPRP